MRPSTGTILIVIIVAGLILGGTFYWATTGNPSPWCGGCYRYNAPGCVVTPCPGRENLTVETSQVNSPTNMTLNIMNTGAVGVTFGAYTVSDIAGHQYAKTSWTGPFVNTNELAAINIVIDGGPFTFQSKNQYTIALTTTRNNIFTFTITA
jgi:hypothetical protein